MKNKATEDTENTEVSGSIVYLATGACKTGFCRGVLPSSTGPRMLARLGKLPETTAGSNGARRLGSGHVSSGQINTDELGAA